MLTGINGVKLANNVDGVDSGLALGTIYCNFQPNLAVNYETIARSDNNGVFYSIQASRANKLALLVDSAPSDYADVPANTDVVLYQASEENADLPAYMQYNGAPIHLFD